MRRPQLFLILALALFGLTAPLIRWLVLHGGSLSGAESSAISFCNVLFIGNLCAGVVFVAWFGPRRLSSEWVAASRRARGALGGIVLLSIAIPSLIFTALEHTSVVNVVLLSRFQPVALAILSLGSVGTRGAGRQWLAHVAVAMGIALLLWLQGGFTLQRGDGLVLFAAILAALCTLLARTLGEACSRPLLIFARSLVGAFVFFWIAVLLFGFSHFGSAFSDGLWLVMTLYALLVVVIGQYAWLRALGTLPELTLAKASVLTPVFGLFFAFVLLGEAPDRAQWLAAVLILGGMLLGSGAAAAQRPEVQGMERTLAAA